MVERGLTEADRNIGHRVGRLSPTQTPDHARLAAESDLPTCLARPAQVSGLGPGQPDSKVNPEC